VTWATNVNCMQADWNATVVILTSNWRWFFYNYSGTTLTYNYDRAITSFLAYLRPFVFHNAALNGSTLEQQMIRNYRQFAIWITKTGWVTNGIVKVAVNWAWVTWFSSLVPWITYWSDSSWSIGVSGDYIIWKAISTSAILVSIPYANL
jgi:hypothetical protein